MPYITTKDGVRAYYDFAGDGPSLVLVHGASQDSLSWRYVLEDLARYYSVYALDLPGHGKSHLPSGGPNSQTLDNAHFLVQVLDALQLVQPVLMGHSMGGGVITQAAVLAPGRIKGLVLVDGASVDVVTSSGYNPKILDMARINPGDWFEVTFRTLMGQRVDAARVDEVIADARRCSPEVAFADICAFGGFRMEKILSGVKCPVVIVQGAEDWSVPCASARKAQSMLEERGVPVDYVEWPDVGHFPHAEHPEAFVRDTLAAMQRLGL